MKLEAGAAPRAASPTGGEAHPAGRTPPYVHVRRLTRGWRVYYVSSSGRDNRYRCGLTEDDARARGAALARLFDCPLEVDDA